MLETTLNWIERLTASPAWPYMESAILFLGISFFGTQLIKWCWKGYKDVVGLVLSIRHQVLESYITRLLAWFLCFVILLDTWPGGNAGYWAFLMACASPLIYVLTVKPLERKYPAVRAFFSSTTYWEVKYNEAGEQGFKPVNGDEEQKTIWIDPKMGRSRSNS